MTIDSSASGPSGPPNAKKITLADARIIRLGREVGIPSRRLGKAFGISHVQAWKIGEGLAWPRA